jgi:hypothetical protein
VFTALLQISDSTSSSVEKTKTRDMSSPGSNGDEDHFQARWLPSSFEVLLEL